MATNLETLVESLKRAAAPAGQFATYFPDTTDDDLTAQLLDGFAEAQLDGYFPQGTYSATDDGVVTPDLVRAEGALIIIYSAHRMLAADLRHRRTHTRYQAGSAEAETDQSAQVLRALFDELTTRKRELVEQARRGNVASGFHMADMYYIKATQTYATDFTVDRAVAYADPYGSP